MLEVRALPFCRGLFFALAGLVLAGCGAGAPEALPTTEPTVALGTREDPALVGTTIPALSFFIAQPDGSLVASLSDASLEEGVLFPYRSAELTPEARALLAELLPEVARHSGPVRVDGFADGVGPSDWNQSLSERRAQAVAAWLREEGVGVEITVQGHGEEGAENDVPDPSRRRVDITLEAPAGEVESEG